MFCSRFVNNKISKLHERALRIVYDDYNSKFEELLTKDGSFTKHHQNIQTVAIEMSKIRSGFSQVSFLDFFQNFDENNFHSLRSQPGFHIPSIYTALKGIESVGYFGLEICNNIPIEIRNIKISDTFKTEIRK